MSERKKLTISQVKEIEKVGSKQFEKLQFKASDGEKEFWYQVFKTSLFDVIKPGVIIDADVETSSREYEGQTYTDRRIVQIYVDGQPIAAKKGDHGGWRGKSPEELELQARGFALAYAKDLAVAAAITISEIELKADEFHAWLTKGMPKKTSPAPGKQLVTKGREPAKVIIDMTWLKESLKTLEWSPTTYLLKKYPKVKGDTITLMLETMTGEQQKEFTAEIQRRLDIASSVSTGILEH